MALFVFLIIRTFQLVFSARTVFFSHNKSTETVFWLVFFSSEANGALLGPGRRILYHAYLRLSYYATVAPTPAPVPAPKRKKKAPRVQAKRSPAL